MQNQLGGATVAPRKIIVRWAGPAGLARLAERYSRRRGRIAKVAPAPSVCQVLADRQGAK